MLGFVVRLRSWHLFLFIANFRCMPCIRSTLESDRKKEGNTHEPKKERRRHINADRQDSQCFWGHGKTACYSIHLRNDKSSEEKNQNKEQQQNKRKEKSIRESDTGAFCTRHIPQIIAKVILQVHVCCADSFLVLLMSK